MNIVVVDYGAGNLRSAAKAFSTVAGTDATITSDPAKIRSADRIATEKRHLKRKWKAHITFENYKSQDKVAMHVPRRQSVALA